MVQAMDALWKRTSPSESLVGGEGSSPADMIEKPYLSKGEGVVNGEWSRKVLSKRVVNGSWSRKVVEGVKDVLVGVIETPYAESQKSSNPVPSTCPGSSPSRQG
jgi:hypothetical protein